jgi:uncharacterized protein
MLELWHFPVLMLAAFVAGFVDSIAGGGGLITIPALLWCGVPPQYALGTNKLQASFGSGSAAWHYAQAGAVSLKDCRRGFVITMVGAAFGAWLVQQLDPSFLRRAIPVLLIAVAVYMLVRPSLGEDDAQPRMSRGPFDVLFGLGIGFYDGFFGPGTGTFWAMAFVLVLGFHLTRATGYTKVMNFASNLSSLAVFLIGGKVLFIAGLLMGGAQLFGARLGSQMVIARGTGFIRPFFVAASMALALKLLWDSFSR